MKTTKLVLGILMAIAISVTACKKEDEDVVACFTVNKQQAACQGFTFQFTDCSENADRHEWDFGDGEQATIGNPTHQYEEWGTYRVLMTAYNGSESKSQELTVSYGLPQFTAATVSFITDIAPDHCSTTVLVEVESINSDYVSPGHHAFNTPLLQSPRIKVYSYIICQGGTSLDNYHGQERINLCESLSYPALEYTSDDGGKILVDLEFEVRTQ